MIASAAWHGHATLFVTSIDPDGERLERGGYDRAQRKPTLLAELSGAAELRAAGR